MHRWCCFRIRKRLNGKNSGRSVQCRKLQTGFPLPHLVRAEAYDISNTSGIESVGSMVVFENGRPKKNDYRKFKIKTVKGPDDYKSMREVLTRRFLRGKEQSEGFAVYPDIIMMDGGRGQVNIALEVLKELDLHIPVCGMVKDDNPQNPRTLL